MSARFFIYHGEAMIAVVHAKNAAQAIQIARNKTTHVYQAEWLTAEMIVFRTRSHRLSDRSEIGKDSTDG